MAPTHHDSEDTHNQTSATSDSFEDMIEQDAAHIEAVCQDTVSNNMQPQKVIEGCFTHPISAVKELLASMKASDGLTTGEGEVHVDAFVHDVEMHREANREMLARVEEVSSMLEQIHTAQLLFVDGVKPTSASSRPASLLVHWPFSPSSPSCFARPSTSSVSVRSASSALVSSQSASSSALVESEIDQGQHLLAAHRWRC